jgi:iron(III) transport system ATP-binding protein
VSAITCTGITKSFGSFPVHRGLDLRVPDGAVVTVLGESGSGKTTLLRMIAGFDRPDAGTITVGDQVVDDAGHYVPPERRRVGYVAQEGNLFPHLNVAKNIAFGLPRRERGAGRVEELLDLVGLADLGKRYPHELSGGQQQRVALARALAPRPDVILLDEPFSSLDAGLRASLRFDVMRILRQQQATTVFVTHDQQEALSVADLAGIINDGKIRQFATPEILYTRPADPGIARFLGDANIVPGTVSADTPPAGSPAAGPLSAGSLSAGPISAGTVGTALGELPLADGNVPLYGPASVLIRPEQILLQPRDHQEPGPGRVSGQVIHREYYGHDCVLLVNTGDGARPLRVRCPGRSPIQAGDSVLISARGTVIAWPASPQDPAGN